MLTTPAPRPSAAAMTPARPALALVLLVLASAPAVAATLHLASSAPVDVEGDVTVRVADGRLRWDAATATGTVVVTVPRGVAHFWSQEGRAVDPALAPVLQADRRETDPVDDPVVLENATLEIRFVDEPFFLALFAANGTTLDLEGAVDAAGRPSRYAADFSPSTSARGPADDVVFGPSLPVLRWTCARGFAAQGESAVLAGFPFAERADAALLGDFQLYAGFGTVSVRDAGGVVERRLGREVVEPTPGVHRERVTVLRLDATGAVRTTLSRDWAACGPGEAWALDGAATWRDATGSVETEDGRREFEGATVDAVGILDLRVEAGPVATPPARYGGDGDALIRVDGALVAAPARGDGPRAVEALTLAAVVAALVPFLLKGAVAAYTRLHREQVLGHPRRKVLFDLVTARPGIHQRELHRAVGGAWGPFTFHLRVLREAGYVRSVGTRGYAQVYPVGAPVTGPASGIPHPVPRAIYAALPADGRPVRVVDVRREIGISPQLMRHHLRGLAERRLVVVEGPALGEKSVRRA